MPVTVNTRRFRDLRIRLVGADLTFQFKNTAGVERWANKANRFDRGARNMQPVFEDFGRYYLRSIDRTFQAEGRPSGWAALKPATIADRQRQGYGAGPILQRTGKLRDGFDYRALPQLFALTNDEDYMVHHQYGAPRANIPRRMMVQLLSQDRAQFTRMYRKHLGVD